MAASFPPSHTRRATVKTAKLTRQDAQGRERPLYKAGLVPLLQRWANLKNCTIADIKSNLSETEAVAYTMTQDEAVAKLAKVLSKVRLVQLQTKIEALPTDDSSILVPEVSRSRVLQNADQATFADVVAPYLLVKSKPVEIEKHGAVNDNAILIMETEVSNCGLLIDTTSPRPFALLRALLAVWGGELDDDRQISPCKRSLTGSNDPVSELQKSLAFPENCFDTPFDEGVKYLPVVEIGGIWGVGEGDNGIELPEYEHLPEIVDLVVLTNAKTIMMTIPQCKSVWITASSLDDNGSLNLAPGEEHDSWHEFLKRVRRNVRIKFVFTRWNRSKSLPQLDQ
jgi:hypothetical protein